MSILDAVVRNAAQANREEPGDYRGEDGLLYCGKCNTPKEWADQDGKVFPCSCRCSEEAAKREKEKIHRVENFSRACSLPIFKELHDQDAAGSRFDQHDGTNPRALHIAKTYVEQWDKVMEHGGGLLLWGDIGTGKTFLSGCIANALMTKGVPTLMTSATRILSAVSGADRNKNAVFDSLRAFDLLVLDDFGAERQSPFALEQITRLIDDRSKVKKPMILSTNLTLSMLKNPENLELARIYDRVMAVCVPVQLTGESHRAKQAEERLKWMREILDA